ncbi:MAG: hypothetical protein ABSG75_14555 [Syntrophales bacterium]|jgi:hypothetical protein
MSNDEGVVYDRSPAPPVQKEKAPAPVTLDQFYGEQPHDPDAEVENEYLGFSEIELPRQKQYGGKSIEVDRMHARDLALHIHKALKDSLIHSGESLTKTLKHYRGALAGSGLMDKDSLAEFKTLSEKIMQAGDYREKRRLLDEEVGPWLRGITLKRG